MAARKTLFNILKDAGGALSGLTGLSTGDAIGSKVAALVTAFQDASGDAVFPTLTSTGAVPVASPGTCRKSVGPNPLLAGTTTLTEITNSAITLTASKNHFNVEGVVSSMVESCFQIVQDNNGVELVLATIQVGPGQFSVPFKFDCMEVISGATGTQELLLKGANASTDEVADLIGWLGVKEAA